MIYAWDRWYLEEKMSGEELPGRLHLQNVVLAEIGVHKLTSVIHHPQGNHELRIKFRQLSRRNICVLQPR